MTAHLGPVLAVYATGDVSPGERARVDEHLATCAVCRAELAGDRAVLERLVASPPPVAPITLTSPKPGQLASASRPAASECDSSAAAYSRLVSLLVIS